MSDEKQKILLEEIRKLLEAPPNDFDYEKAQGIWNDLKEADLGVAFLAALTQKINDTQYKYLLGRAQDILDNKLDEEKIQQGQNLLDDAYNLVGDKSEIQEMRAKLDENSGYFRALKKFEETKQACEALWMQEQDAVRQKTTSDKILEEIFDKAQSLAKKAAAQFPRFLALDGLKNDAVMRYQIANDRYQIKTTANKTNEYREAFERLEKIENPETLIPWNDARGQQLDAIPVRQAMLEMLSLAGNFAHQKTQEYLHLATVELEINHAPRSAREQIEKRKDLWELHSEDNEKLQKYLDEKILPEIAKLEKAEGLIQQASIIYNLEQGWTLLDEAVKTYAWVPNLDVARASLVGRMLHQAEKQLNESAQSYAAFQPKENMNNSALADAQTKLADASRLLELASSSANDSVSSEKVSALSQKKQELGLEISSARKFVDEVETKSTRWEGLFAEKPAQIQAEFEDSLATYNSPQYIKKYGNPLERFPRLQALQTRVQAFRNFETSLKELDETFDDADIEQITATLETAKSIFSDVKGDKSRRERVNALIKKFQGRQEFLEGQRILAETGDMADALTHLRKVAGYANHPDQRAAQELIKNLESQRENENKVSNALANAESWLRTQPSRAYEVLKKVEEIPSQQKKAVKSALERVREQWEEQLLTRLAGLRDSQSADPAVIRKLTEEILNLPEPRSEETETTARKALAHAYALEADIHAEAGRWEYAEISWKAAREKDMSAAEYKQGWRNARLNRAKSNLDRTKGEQEKKDFLADLLNDLPNDAEVYYLKALQAHELSQNLSLDAKTRLDYLMQAQTSIKVAKNPKAPGFSQDLNERLGELNDKVSADEGLLKSQTDLEKRISSDAPLSQLSAAKQEVDRLLSDRNSSSSARADMENWWRGLVPRIVAALEQADDNLPNEQLWEKFEVRTKIALFAPENPRARELVRAVPRQVEDLLDKVSVTLSDRSGLMLEGRDPVKIVEAQQKQVFDLRDRSQTLFEMVERLSKELGGQSSRLKQQIQDARVKIETWMREFDAFRLNVLHLRDFLAQARQDDDWSDFDDILNDKINLEGFGAHRAVRLLLEERDRVVEKRRDLKALHDKIVEATQDPQGLQFTQALNLLDILEKDPRQGDPKDDFGFQNEMQINDPYSKKPVRQARNIRVWLEERQKQVENALLWIAECGLVDLVPTTVILPANGSRNKRLLPWKETREKLARTLEQGRFEEVLVTLSVALRDGKDDAEAFSKSPLRRSMSNSLEITLESFEDFIRLEDARNKISNPPFPMDAGLSKMVVNLLQQAAERLKVLDENIKDVNHMRKSVSQKQRDWKDSQLELEQALGELRNAKDNRNPFGRDKMIQSARARAQKALVVCKEIAPRHPVLDNVEELLK